MAYTASVSTSIPTARNAPPSTTTVVVRDADGKPLRSGSYPPGTGDPDHVLEAFGWRRTSPWKIVTPGDWSGYSTAEVAPLDEDAEAGR